MRIDLHRPARYIALAVLALAVTALSALSTSPPDASAANSDIKINEVESNGGTPGDWVELINTGTESIDITGWKFRDGDTGHAQVVVPSGAILAPGGFYVLNEIISTVGQFPFGLGDDDSVALWLPDGTTEIATFSWGPHSPTSLGRCPDGTGAFKDTTTTTKGAANDCSNPVKINEIESDGGTPADWIELFNPSLVVADLSGSVIKDSGEAGSYTFPASTTLAAGGYRVLNKTTDFTFELDASDSARYVSPTGTVLDSASWTSHASTTLGRCPNGTGAMGTTLGATKGMINNCPAISLVKINEVESDGGTDFIELYNTGDIAANVSGFKVIDSGGIGGAYTFPADSSIPARGFLALRQTAGQLTFGLGAADSARLFAPDGLTLIDSFSWTSHAPTTWGRCPDGSGPFVPTLKPTEGAANCPPVLPAEDWPGGNEVVEVDEEDLATTNISGLAYEPSGTDERGVLWAVRNDAGALFRLVWDGTNWVPDSSNNWGAGKLLRYLDDTGNPDAEGVTFGAGGPNNGIFVSTERNNANGSVSRPAILLFDPTASGPELTAVRDWNLTSDLPGLGQNLGAEAIVWLPDAYLTSQGYWDESKNKLYTPSDYPLHVGGGLFFVAVENNGNIYTYALNSDSTFTRVAGVASGFPSVAALDFDAELGEFWAWCDNSCASFQNSSKLFEINSAGKLEATHLFNRPEGLPADMNNEGFATTSQAECVDNRKPVFWADDDDGNDHSIREGTVDCYINDADFDDDNDGIADVIDLLPETPSDRFSDVILGGATVGALIQPVPAGLTVTITDLEAPGGVHVSVTGSGSQEARIALDGKLGQFFFKVGEYNLTDPVNTIEVQTIQGGPARVVYTIAGKPVEVLIDLGESARITETTDSSGNLLELKVESLMGIVTVNGTQVPAGGLVLVYLPDACRTMPIDKIVVGGPGNDTITGSGLRELIVGNGGNDTINGGAGNDCIAGTDGNDRLSGGSGNDKLVGEAGNDTLIGDSGTDQAIGDINNDSCDAENELTCES